MQDFSHCLSEARKKSGFSQADCAHLLGVSQSYISRLELAHSVPSVADISGVAVLFGRTMEIMLEPLLKEQAMSIRARLYDLPEPKIGWLGRFTRTNALNKLENRLDRIARHYDS
ncbi:helix-turn-helix domain-containing protein [Sulfitobacter sp. JBTF-M27]|uniref:Helix-turn-helix domain-containing protein n=2 Tax=Sulfitobacter sediminilitoris TaxID=2698830 RepID=A0A6P0CD80_9RHOB|nr:helix-turn-helix transcriptional regulator [Sulfitobacter sediminilitoris]NEK24201.1 helix-turn-helix domain-containing protein [Sulfitobacter sediminilitoris]